MLQHEEEGDVEIIAELISLIQAKLPKEQAELIAVFARQFYGTVDEEELRRRDIMDLYGAILSHWDLLYKRQPGKTKIRVYNPNYEQHGWQSTHTIVEVVQEDMPFLVDSMRMEINRQGWDTHLMIHRGGMKLKRDAQGYVTAVLPFATPVTKDVTIEAPIYIEIDRQTEPKVLEKLHESFSHVLCDVRCAVEDWTKMRGKLREALTEIEHLQVPLEPDEIDETRDFLRWLENDHFTFLGYRDYEVTGEGDKMALRIIPASGLGVLRDSSSSKVYRTFASLTPEARKLALSQHILIISKTNTRSTVHRPAYTDYVGIKRFNEKGELVGEHRFIGLYTSSAYNRNTEEIPFVRRKVAMIMKNSGLSPTGHAGKALLNILETLPRDDLFQATSKVLTELAVGILHLQERKQIRLFVRMDVYHRFVSCMVYVPRDRFDTELGYAMQDVLIKAFNGVEISFETWFSESILARIHYIIKIDPKTTADYNTREIEKKLIEVGRSWKDDLKENLLDSYGEAKGNRLYQKYRYAFAAGYREMFNARVAIYDIEHIESLSDRQPLTMSFYRPLEYQAGSFRFKLFRIKFTVPLSDAIPIFENMGLRVIGERPYEITFEDSEKVWINDFNMVYSEEAINFQIEEVKNVFQEAFYHIWYEHAENDGFNQLVLSAHLSWREITIIRAYTKYLRQAEFTYSQSYIEKTFAKFPHLAVMLVKLFHLRFDPKQLGDETSTTKLSEQFEKELEAISVLDEDRIIRSIYDLIHATLRTNYFQKDAHGRFKKYLSLKLDPSKVSDLPLPLPMFEIFVYSPRFEGVHLRSSKVARGGLRWSDRREDFRTEILGLMKAQNVKNAVIVPSGAKGGFVPKNLPTEGGREKLMEEVVYCYSNFIRGLLDVTDNMQGSEITPPQNVMRYDDDDPYLVVAADKGTATFSDIANNIAAEYAYWLGDAFASGGITGYDHKKMGITARGAWTSVKRHFREIGHDIQNKDFTVIGIGDMAGDVFGNGMLLSKHIKMVGAFNHQHIFLDPNPDIGTSYKERERLFTLARSTWEDYDRNLISQGGGIYRRTSKAIKLSPEVKTLLDIKKDFIIPNELIKAMLRAQVDLLWNGGIGTFVKHSEETHAEAGDRSNDSIRINGDQLRCRVAGEGGNLGFTQLGRVEYALKDGRIYTDFIDNSGGVDCSDREVNIKILLGDVVANGDMTIKQRNELLATMQDEVAKLVLHNNYHQTQAISLAESQAKFDIDLHSRYIQALERREVIDRELEFLPDDQDLLDRKAQGKGLTKPELAVLFAYCKSDIKNKLLLGDVPEDPYLSTALEYSFPGPLRKKHRHTMQAHRLRRDIIATLLSNNLVNEMGFTFVHQLQIETGATVSAIVRAYTITRNIFELPDLWAKIEKLDYKVDAAIQIEMMAIITRLIRRATRWFLRNRRGHLDIATSLEYFSVNMKTLCKKIPTLLAGASKEKFTQARQRFIEADVPETFAVQIASEWSLTSALDIIEAATVYNYDLEELAAIYFSLGEHLELGWLRDQIDAHSMDSQWDALAKEACRDDLDWQQRGLAAAILQDGTTLKTPTEKIEVWIKRHQALIERWHNMLANLRGTATLSFIMFTVAVRELMDLTQTSFQAIKMDKQKYKKPVT